LSFLRALALNLTVTGLAANHCFSPMNGFLPKRLGLAGTFCAITLSKPGKSLELNLRIKAGKGLNREKPDPLAGAEEINQVWSMDFMHDPLSDGRSF